MYSYINHKLLNLTIFMISDIREIVASFLVIIQYAATWLLLQMYADFSGRSTCEKKIVTDRMSDANYYVIVLTSRFARRVKQRLFYSLTGKDRCQELRSRERDHVVEIADYQRYCE